MLHLSNEHLSVALAPERGAEIRELRAGSGPNALAYYDWSTPAETTAIHQYGDSELDWLSAYRGGWQETIPNAGSETKYAGVDLAFHGESSVLEWRVVESDPTYCVLEVGLRLPLTVRRTMRLHPDRATLLVETTVTNESPLEVPFVWGHHPCFPALDGTTVEVPATNFTTEPAEAGDIATSTGTWPSATNHEGEPVDISVVPDLTTMRCFYLHDHEEGWAVVRQPEGQPSVAMAWDIAAYPSTWVWQMRDEPNFPWFGRMRVVAVEPQRAWPYDGLTGAIGRNQANVLAGGESISSWFALSLLESQPVGRVRQVSRDGEVIEY